MKTSYQFANLLGSVYSGGNVVFTPDGQSILSPVGNRLSVFHLTRNTSTTLPFQTRKPIARLALNPADPNIVLVADEDGRALLVDISRRTVIASINFKKALRAARFSNDGRYIAVSHGSHVQVWKIPRGGARQFNPFELYRVYTGHFDDVLWIEWSKDSSFFLTTSKDHTCRLYSLDPIPLPPNPNSKGSGPSTTRFRPKTFSGHRAPVIAAFWSDDEREIYTVARDGACFVWRGKEPDYMEDSDEDEIDSEEDDREPLNTLGQVAKTQAAVQANNLPETVARIATTRWGLLKRNYFSRPDTRVTCAAFHPASSMLVAGFSDGVFGLWTLPSFDSIHTLSIANSNISSVSLNSTGEWLAFGAQGLGQLLVWEWQSESYILKQQGHYYDINTIAYTADGSVAATGGDDGKIKLWNLESGFCIATFSEHTAPVSALEFSKGGAGVLFSASLDGTVRAWDLLRYRNFRTFTSPSPCQFGSLAVEPNGEIVCAGGTADTFDVYLWNVQTGKLLDVLNGHEAPVSGMMFSPTGSGLLATTSWDRTFRTWEIFKRTATVEPTSLNAEGLTLAFRPDGMEITIATLDGQLSFFDARTSKQTGVIECRRDIVPGRSVSDKVAHKGNAGGTAFTTLSYTADGSCVLAGGNANFICLYSIAERVLLNRWELSLDLSLDGTQDRLDSRKMTEAGAAALLNVDAHEDELTPQEKIDRSLPGAQGAGDFSKKTTRRRARTKAIRFNPTGRSFAAATTLGLLVYSLDARGGLIEEEFDPLELEIDLTPAAVREAMRKGDSLLGLVGALRLNEASLLREVYEQVPISEAPLILSRLPNPSKYLPPLLHLIASQLRPVIASSQNNSTVVTGGTPHVEHTLLFLSHLLSIHGPLIQSNAMKSVGGWSPACRAVAGGLEALRKGVVGRGGAESREGGLWMWEGLQRKSTSAARTS